MTDSARPLAKATGIGHAVSLSRTVSVSNQHEQARICAVSGQLSTPKNIHYIIAYTGVVSQYIMQAYQRHAFQ